MATDTVTQLKPVIEQDTASELYELHNLLRLCAFAEEARRTLQGYADCERIRTIPKEIQENLDRLIRARYNWNEMQDYLGFVLNDMAGRIEALADQEASKHLTQCKRSAA